MRSSKTLDCAIAVDGLDEDGTLLPFLELSALDVRKGTACVGGCSLTCGAVDIDAPFDVDPLTARNAEAEGLGNGGALAFARSCASCHVDGIGAVRDLAMLLPSAKLSRDRNDEDPSNGDLGAPYDPDEGGGDVRKVRSFVGTGGGRPSANLLNSYFLRMYFSSSLSLSLSSMLVGGRLRISSGL